MLNHEIREQIYKIFPNETMSNIQEIRSKDGVSVYRGNIEGKPIIVKYFIDNGSKREIGNYELLEKLGVTTIPIYGKTDSCICMEDIDQSETLRLGISEDLHDVKIVRLLARWYRNLHDKGREYSNLSMLYRESDILTEANLNIIANKIPDCRENIRLILMNLNKINRLLNELEETILYNDFYWTNLAIRKDKTEAFMFDYNLMGRGYRYSDIRNVCSSLSIDSKQVFQQEYNYQFDQKEIVLDECISELISLIFACERKVFPAWATSSLDKIKSDDYREKVENLIKLIR